MLKKVAIAMFTIYSFSSGQAPPAVVVPAVIEPPTPIAPPVNPAVPHVDPVVPPVDPAVPPVDPAVPHVDPTHVVPTTPTEPAVPVVPEPPTAPVPAPAIPVDQLPQLPPVLFPVDPLPPLPAVPAPFGNIFGADGQVCGTPHVDNLCKISSQSASDILTRTPGFLKCERDFDCCPCAAITCGSELGTGCNTFSVGTSGVYGVQHIQINGRPEGAEINCLGLEGCSNTKMKGYNVISVRAAGEMGLRNAVMTMDIINNFQLECDVMGACQGGKFEFVIPGPPPGYACNPAVTFSDFIIDTIRCGGQASCENTEITIRNDGCARAVIQQIQCHDVDSCNNAKFNLVGDVDINQCELGPSGQTAHGLERCFTNLERLLCPDLNACAGPTPRILRDPSNGFLMECGGTTSCAGADVTIVISAMPTHGVISQFDGFKFGGVGSGAGATITIDNQQLTSIVIELIECPSQNSCAGMTIYTGDRVSITQFNCAAGACNGCTYQKDALSPVYACDPDAAFNPMFPGQQPGPQQPPPFLQPINPNQPPAVIPITPFDPAIPPAFVAPNQPGPV